MKINELMDLCRTNVSGARALQTAAAYRQFPLKLSFSSYNRGISWLCEQYAQLGLKTEKLDFPADGKTVYGDRHFPLAWDIEDGWLKVADSKFPISTLASYQEDPYGIVPFSADSNGEQSAFIIPAAELRAGRGRHKPAEVVVLFEQYPGYDDMQWVFQNGFKAAAICASDTYSFGIASSDPAVSGLRRWLNALFGAGQIDARSKTISAYSLRPIDLVKLLEYYKQHGPVPVKYLMRAKAYAGAAPAALACLEGKTGNEQSFMLAAHAYEPNATNNEAGICVCLEAARILTDLIAKGKLPKPRRSIQFFHGLEMFSLSAYALQNPERIKKILAGLVIDSIGCRDHNQVKEKFQFFHGFHINPSFWPFLSEEILAESARKLDIAYEVSENGFSSNDDFLNDPAFGPAFSLIYGTQWFKAGFYHSNGDTPEHLSPERLAELAVCAAASAYSAANAGGHDALSFARLACEGAIRHYTKANARLMAANDDMREKGIALQIYQKATVPVAMAAIESVIKLVPEKEHNAFQPQIRVLSEQFKQTAESITASLLNSLAEILGQSPMIPEDLLKPFRYGQTEIEKKAAAMVPARRLFGILSLGTQSREAKIEAARMIGYYSDEYWNFMAPLYYWFDGKRTLLEAAMTHYAVTDLGVEPASSLPLPSFVGTTMGQKNGRLAMVERFMALADFLEKHGIITVVRNLPSVVNKRMIIEGLEKIGVKAGDVVMVHSSLSQFGEVEGGADAVIDALMDVLGADGILSMPAFTVTADGGKGPPFDPAASKTYTGIICDTFWRRKGVLRNNHPTHSVAAWGKRAAEFLSSNNPSDIFDWNGPFGKLFKWNGKVLSFGETFGATTYLHALEAWFLPYLDRVYARVRNGNGEKLAFVVNYPEGCRGGWYKLRRNAPHFKRLNGRGLYKETKIGAASAMAINVCDMTREMHALFKEDPAVLLHKSGCLPCAERRAKLVGWQIPDYFSVVEMGW